MSAIEVDFLVGTSTPNVLRATRLLHFDASFTFFALTALCILLPVCLYEKRRKSLRLSDFAGPMGWPIVGNIYDIKTHAAEQYRQWSYLFGDAFQVQLGDIPVLVVNTAASAKAIFSGHSNALSSRPTLYTFHNIVSKAQGATMGTAAMSPALNRSRKDTPLGKPQVRTYVKYLDLETREFIRQCLNAENTPLDPLRMLQRMSLSLDMSLCWGRRIALDDPLLVEIATVEHEIVNLRNTMTNLQDCIPLLRHPWTQTTKKALELRQRRDTYFAQLNNELDSAVLAGTHQPCIRADLLGREDVDQEELNLICLTFISAGMAPTVATLQWSLALLAKRPEIQATALGAIREHYGKDMPLGEVEDDQGCQYVVALVKECLRYFTVARTSLPRSTVKEFAYQGRTVPTGTTVFLNAWACNRDSSLWPENADEFDPSRFLANPDAPIFTYGLGARGCSGVALANRFLYLFFVRLISAFEILDEGSGVGIDPIGGMESMKTLVSSPKSYSVVFKPRDEVKLRKSLGERRP